MERSRDRFRREVDELEEAGMLDDAVYITTDGGPVPLISGLDFHEVATEELRLPRLEGVEGNEKRLPTEVETLYIKFRIYKVKME